MNPLSFEYSLNQAAISQTLRDDSNGFMSASPFPHIIIDNFLKSDVYKTCKNDFPVLREDEWINYLHANEKKFANTDVDSWPDSIKELVILLNSDNFVQYLEKLTGISNLIPDTSLQGGGLHTSTKGGFLNVHADFSVHPHNRTWQRRVNILVYFNDKWKDEYLGLLELWNADMSQAEVKISPLGNRAVIFRTDLNSFHGHPDPMRCPDDEFRRSLALYYYTVEKDPKVQSTEYRSRPDDGFKKITIYLDKMALRFYDKIRRRLGLSDNFASNVLAKLSRHKKNK